MKKVQVGWVLRFTNAKQSQKERKTQYLLIYYHEAMTKDGAVSSNARLVSHLNTTSLKMGLVKVGGINLQISAHLRKVKEMGGINKKTVTPEITQA